jgi:uncharacterized protein (DUF1697 family)
MDLPSRHPDYELPGICPFCASSTWCENSASTAGFRRRSCGGCALDWLLSGHRLIIPRMALIVFLRGVNVGGHRTFRPSIVARELSDYDVLNVGAAGTFVVRKPGSRAKFRTALLRKLPFEAEIVLCDGRDLMRLETENPFGTEPSPPDVVRFVSILSKARGVRASLPVTFPSDGEWLVRVIASEGQFVFGVYRRHMKTIGYLGQIDKLYGVPATTRNWNTIVAIVRILQGDGNKGR